MTKEKVAECVGRLTLLRFFPQNAHAVAELARIINELCANDAEGARLTDRVLRLHDQWPGPLELRKCYWMEVAERKPCDACKRYPGWVLSGDRTVQCSCPAGRREREIMALGLSVSRPWICPWENGRAENGERRNGPMAAPEDTGERRMDYDGTNK
jgi:hypothetical protein